MMNEERLQHIAAVAHLPIPLVREWSDARWVPAFKEWLRTAPVGEVAVWIHANAGLSINETVRGNHRC